MRHAASQPLRSIPSCLGQSHFSLLSNLNLRFSVSSFTQTQVNSCQSFATRNELLDFLDLIFQQCTSSSQCKQVHTHVIVTGLYQSAFLSARIISVYARSGLLFHAQKVFDTTPFECLSNLLVWNSILRTSVSYGHYESALEIYDKMRKLGVFGDGFTFPLVIRACAFMGRSSLCKTIHGHVLQMGFQYHLHVANELMGMYAKLGQMDDARNLFDRMCFRSNISWNTMVSGYAFNYDCNGAFEMFQRMESDGLEPNPVTWASLLSSHARCGNHEEVLGLFEAMRIRGIQVTAEALAVVLSACADLIAFDRGKWVHGYVVKGGFKFYLFVGNALISVYGKCGDVKGAESLFLEMENKNIVSWNALIASYADGGLLDKAFVLFSQLEQSDGCSVLRPNVVSWSAVIGGFASQGREDESLELFRQMQLANVKPNSVTISTILSVCAQLASLNIGREIHGHVMRALMDDNILVENGLLNMYTKCGCLEQGRLIFEKIERKDLYSWNSMITGYGMHGLGDNALTTFDEIIKSRFKPDAVTFVAVLSACSHAGLVAEGRELFSLMLREYSVEPEMEHYACMVDLLGRAGFLQEASNFVKNMPMEPNACVLGALLNSCRMHKSTRVAEEIASHIFSRNSETTGSYMLLSNIYATSGQWDDSARVRISAKTKGLRKSPGQSWIEVNKTVYVFSAGNNVQPGMETVVGIIEELALHMESKSYTPGRSLVIQDADEEEVKLMLQAQ